MMNTTEKQERRWNQQRRHCFAKFCAERRHQLAPSGITWAEVFLKKEGMTLDTYRRKLDEHRRKSKTKR